MNEKTGIDDLSRPDQDSSLENLGLILEDAKALLEQLERVFALDRVETY